MKADSSATVRPTMKLSRLERSELVVEAIITLGIVFFLYLSVILLVREFIDVPFTWGGRNAISFRTRFFLDDATLAFLLHIFSVFSIILGILITFWRVKRRIRLMKLEHVLQYVTYIAQGNYDIRIPTNKNPELAEVITSINLLVDSTVEALNEERRIEKTKDELITNVGHDLRTPLTSIIGYLGLIENKQYHEHKEVLQYTHTAYTKALHMQSLVDDLFDYAASRQTTYELKSQPLQIALFLEQLAADFELAANEKEIVIKVDVTPQNLTAHLDVEKMARVFNNLITNALKYGHGASFIHLKAYPKANDSERIIFEVLNDGTPINEAELEKIFERSYRADHSRHSDEPGSGLGLAIVSNIIELHQGHVYAANENNQTVFRIEIPQNINKVTK